MLYSCLYLSSKASDNQCVEFGGQIESEKASDTFNFLLQIDKWPIHLYLYNSLIAILSHIESNVAPPKRIKELSKGVPAGALKKMMSCFQE